MNNNRGGNNRRRGRGNNTNGRPQSANGGQQVNRIDSRARGNAPQMLEKYRKLANDAHLNGDRVNAEYYLQFADHYFRVIADTRVRQEEQRLRRDDRWQEGDGVSDEGDDSGDFSVETEFASFDQPPVYTRREREDRPERTERTAVTTDRGQDRPQPQPEFRRQDRQSSDQPNDRPNDRMGARSNGRHGDTAPEEQALVEPATGEYNDKSGAGEASGDAVTAYEPPENPFLRENRGGRGLRPRREDRRPRREDRPERELTTDETPDTDRAARAVSAGIDPETLPPSFTVSGDEPPVGVEEAPAPAPTPRRRAKRKPAADDTGEPIQSLN